MKHQIGKLTLTAVSLSLLGSVSAFAALERGPADDGIGRPGVAALAANNIPLSERYYDAEYLANPGNPLTIYNQARSFDLQGRRAEARRFYSQAAAVGTSYVADHYLEAANANTTIHDLACLHLAEHRWADPNCPGVAALPPSPTVAAAPPPVRVAQAEAVRKFTVFFDFDKSDITPEARQVIASAVETAKRTGPVRIMVTGHTDTVGTHAYNQRLSERRAAAVKREMMMLGMNEADIGTIGKSFDDPLVPTGPGVYEPQNRRAMIDLGPPAVG